VPADLSRRTGNPVLPAGTGLNGGGGGQFSNLRGVPAPDVDRLKRFWKGGIALFG